MSKIFKNFSENELLSALQNDDKNSIKYVYQSFWSLNRKFMKHYNGRLEDAEDLYQESMLAFLKKVQCKNFKRECLLTTFFVSICRNQWRSFLKKSRKFTDLDAITNSKHPIEETLKEDWLPDDEHLTNAVNSLPPAQRNVIEDFYWQKKRLTQIAQERKYRGPEVVKQIKHRAVLQLKQILKEAA